MSQLAAPTWCDLVTNTQSLDEVLQFTESASQYWCADDYFLATMRTACDEASPQSNIVHDVIGGTLSDDEISELVTSQFEDFCKDLKQPENRVVPKYWSRTSKCWKTLPNITDEYFRKQRPNDDLKALSLLSKIDSETSALLVATNPAVQSKKQYTLFLKFGLKLLDQIAKLQQKPATDLLSRNERNCLVWGACGKTSSEIAIILSLSEHTVNHYFTIAATKLGANNRTHATAKAIQQGIIRFDEIQ